MEKYSKLKAMNYCHKNGVEFVNLFKQLFISVNETTKKEILDKMQIIFGKVNNIFITNEGHLIFHSQKMNWFYTATSSYDELFDDEEMKIKYDEFVLLIETNKDAKSSYNQITINSYTKTNNNNFERYNNILILDLLTIGTTPKLNNIVKFGYTLLNKRLDIILNGEFYVKHDKSEINEKFKTKHNISLDEIENGQDENFIFYLIKRLVTPKTLLISFNIPVVTRFLNDFLLKRHEEDIIAGLNTLDLLNIYKTNNKNKKLYNLKGAIKFYNINCQFCKTNAMIYYLLLNEMIKNNDIGLYIKRFDIGCLTNR